MMKMFFMRLCFVILILNTVAFGQEILRPNSDVQGNGNGGCGLPNTWTMPNAYDASGESTDSFIRSLGDPGYYDFFDGVVVPGKPTRLYCRIFKGFPSATRSYSTLVLKVRSSCQISDSQTTNGGDCGLWYSRDGGVTYTLVGGSGTGWTATTDTVSLPVNQDIRLIRVEVSANGYGGDGLDSIGEPVGMAAGTATVFVWDVRTEGTY